MQSATHLSPFERRRCVCARVLSEDKRAARVCRQELGEVVHPSVDNNDARLRWRWWLLRGDLGGGSPAGELLQKLPWLVPVGAEKGFAPRVAAGDVVWAGTSGPRDRRFRAVASSTTATALLRWRNPSGMPREQLAATFPLLCLLSVRLVVAVLLVLGPKPLLSRLPRRR